MRQSPGTGVTRQPHHLQCYITYQCMTARGWWVSAEVNGGANKVPNQVQRTSQKSVRPPPSQTMHPPDGCSTCSSKQTPSPSIDTYWRQDTWS